MNNKIAEIITYGTSFNISYTVLGNTNYILKDDSAEISKVQNVLKSNHPEAFEKFNIYRAGKLLDEQPQESKKLIKEVLQENPKSPESYHVLAKIQLVENHKVMADSLITKSLNHAEYQKQRQWKINEIIETKSKIQNTRK